MKNLKNNKIKYLLMCFLSAVIQSIVLTSFTFKANLYPAGVSGFSRLASDILIDKFNISVSYSVFYFTINVILAVIVYKYVGKWFTILSLVQTITVSLLSEIMPPIFDLTDMLLLSIFGGIVNGLSSGLALENNASTGGMDFVTIYYSNKYNKSLWNYTFAFNSIIVIMAGIIYGWERACYSIIFQFCTTTVVKKMHRRYTHKTITIITKHPNEVTSEILSHTRHGITVLDGKGAYKNEEQAMLYTVVNYFQVDDVIESVLKADQKAFINIQNTLSVKGNYYQKPLE